MNKFVVTIYYQLQVYNGWSCNYPYNEIVDNQYVVESSKSMDDFERLPSHKASGGLPQNHSPFIFHSQVTIERSSLMPLGSPRLP